MTTKKTSARAGDQAPVAAPAAPETATRATGPSTPTPTPTASDTDIDTGTGDFVTFVVDGEVYAFPMERVEEIIRMPQVVRMPLGPPSLVGLANLRGRVLPVVGLRSCCGLPVVEDDEATRVIVVDGGATLGFVVDRVSSVTSVDVDRIEAADRLGGTIDNELLSGVIKPAAGDGELIKVLDVARLVAGQFAQLAERSTGDPGAASRVAPGGPAVTSEETDDDTLELVSFAVDGQEYALPIDRVQEIVQAPEQVTTVPNAHDRVLGVMDLRGRLLPVVSLRKVFGLSQAPLEPQNRIVVVQLPGTGPQAPQGGVVGVVMDTVREVLRVPRDLVADLPAFMAGSGRSQDVDAVCRLEEGRRLVSVLSVERMFAREDLTGGLREIARSEQADGPEGEDAGMAADGAVQAGPGHDGDDELLIVFRLADEEYSVDVDAVQEIIRVPDTLIRVPKALDFVEGLVSLRGAVMPVVDLRTRLGLERGERDERQRIIVLMVDGVRTGFIVDSVTEVLRVSRQYLEAAPELSAEQSRLVRQVANLAASQRMLMMLEPEHLLAADQLDALIPHQRGAGADALVP